MKKQGRPENPNPQQAERWHRRAGRAFDSGDLAKAQHACKKAVSLDPTNSQYWYELAVASDELGDREGALEAYRVTARLQPDYHWAANRLGLLLLEDEYIYDAAQAFRQALRFSPNEDAYWANLAYATDKLGDLQESSECFRQAAALKPKNLYYLRMLADTRHNLGNYAGAAEAYRQILQLRPRDHAAWHNLGLTFYESDRYAQALKPLREAVKLKPDDHLYWNMLGSAAEAAGKNEEAVKAYRRATQLKPQNIAYLHNLGETCTLTGRHGEATRAFRRAAAMNMEKYAPATSVADKRRSRMPQVLSASVDLKLTPEGKIKICEFNDLWHSGLEGYKCVTGQDMHEEIIKPFYEQLARSIRLQGLPVDKIRVREDGGDDDLLGFFSSSRGKRLPAVAANADPGFQALCVYKDYLSAVIPDHLSDFVPRTVVAPLSGNATTEIAGGPSGLAVIKPADALQGRGVEIMPPNAVPARVKDIAAIFNKASAGIGQYWDNNIHPNILVQSCEQSVPVPAADGKLYDGTMRVAFTAVFMPGAAKPDIHFHGAYWKLPENPVGGGRESIISFSPSAHIQGKAEEVFAAKPFAAPASFEHQQAAERQLTPFLQDLLPVAVAGSRDFFHRVVDFLDSDQEWKRALGTRLATDHAFGNLLAKEGGKGVIDTLLNKMRDGECAHPADAAARYLKHIFSAPRHPHTARESQFNADVAEYVRKKDRAAIELRQLSVAIPV